MASPSGPPPEGGAYDRFAYPGYAYPQTHPAHLEVLGRLFGLSPAPAPTARVLELGCGDGGNALSLAAALPGASVVGVDLSPSSIERGVALATAAGLDNVRLVCADLERLPEDLGEFDYVIAHGVYSWIPEPAREALLAAARRLMSPGGLAYVSYNAYPGSHLRAMAREILLYHVRDIDDPEQRLAAAHELMRTIVEIDEPTPYARVLREHLERTLEFSDPLLFHDDLAAISTPFYFHEFVEHAARHGLRFVCEADLGESQMRGVPQSAADLMASLPDDPVVREQYLDFFKNRVFRMTVLCQAEAEVTRVLDVGVIPACAISAQLTPGELTEDGETFTGPHGSVTSPEPVVRATMRALSEAWPRPLSFEQLLELAGGAPQQTAPILLDVLLQSYLARIVELRSTPPQLTSEPGERPLASPLARAQLAAGRPVLNSLLHANARLTEELDIALLPLLDGSRDRAALAAAAAAPGSGDPTALEEALERLAHLGLLAA